MQLPHTITLIDAEACARVHTGVEKLRRYWTPRHDELPSYTLGAAAYLDIPTAGHQQYFARATRSRRALHRDFGWLYDRLTAAIGDLFGAPAVISSAFAPPGFHIFEAHERLGELQPKLHFDLQHERLDWSRPPRDEERFSFTIPITIPEAGAGLRMWPILHEETLAQDDDALEALYAASAPEYHAYTPGELFLHDGRHLHQIAADHPMRTGEVRMTFQGHGVFDDGAWQLYW